MSSLLNLILLGSFRRRLHCEHPSSISFHLELHGVRALRSRHYDIKNTGLSLFYIPESPKLFPNSRAQFKGVKLPECQGSAQQK